MIFETREVRPGPRPRQVLNEYGVVETVPAHWDLLAPGDPALSRRIKLDGPSMTVVELRGRKRFSRGIWAPADRLAALRDDLAVERQDPSHQRRIDAGRRRREGAQEVYAADFRGAVLLFLGFHASYRAEAELLAERIAAHAVPVGSGTVARTARIPIGERAAAATIAWMRHNTTSYDSLRIPREKGRRREMRRMLAQRSVQLLERYRAGQAPDSLCPLRLALQA